MNDLEAWNSGTVYSGQKYGRYTILSTHRKIGTYVYLAYCQCDCGSPPRYVPTGTLRNGEAKSCGCYHKERVTTHGAWKHPLFRIWTGMMQRCYSKNSKSYKHYGGRGITVCELWHDVNSFLADMAPTFSKRLQLDRIDNDKGYSPDNCRWATTSQQARNYRRNIFLEYQGKRLCLTDWAAITGVNYFTLRDRVVAGWPVARILTTKTMTAKQATDIARHVRWHINK